jgi:hypothetical protein
MGSLWFRKGEHIILSQKQSANKNQIVFVGDEPFDHYRPGSGVLTSLNWFIQRRLINRTRHAIVSLSGPDLNRSTEEG